MSEELRVAVDGPAWTFALNRPDKRNALSAALVEALLDGVARAHSAGAALLVFRGEGSNFSAGFDFGGVEAQSEGDLLLRFVRIEQLLNAIGGSPALTLALAHGRNFGAGVDIVGACRLRMASADASFRMPGLKFGLVLGTRRFGAIVGAAQARAILQEARTFDAAQALAMGFVERLAAPADWGAAVAAARDAAVALEAPSRAALYERLGCEAADADLAALVRSAARPGLKDRIAAYLRGG
ncbi:MAG: enoyl-CoA hydratase/isomerase family protein [Pseudomonadota bacterium]